MKNLLISLLILIACSNQSQAQTEEISDLRSMSHLLSDRPVSSSLEIHLGSASVRNSYLAPLLYTGKDLGISYERQRDWRYSPWMSLQRLDGQFTMGEDRGTHSENWSGRFRYRYAAHCQWLDLVDNLAVMAGPYLGAEIGFDYNLKTAAGNNPATARAAVNTGLSLMGSYRYELFHRHSIVSLQLQAPLLGYALMPEYGASYYETFYLGNTQHLHHFTSLHNQQDLDLRLTTDIPVFPRRGGALRIGLAWHIETMDINQTINRFSSLEAVVGWSFQCIPMKTVNYKR